MKVRLWATVGIAGEVDVRQRLCVLTGSDVQQGSVLEGPTL